MSRRSSRASMQHSSCDDELSRVPTGESAAREVMARRRRHSISKGQSILMVEQETHEAYDVTSVETRTGLAQLEARIDEECNSICKLIRETSSHILNNLESIQVKLNSSSSPSPSSMCPTAFSDRKVNCEFPVTGSLGGSERQLEIPEIQPSNIGTMKPISELFFDTEPSQGQFQKHDAHAMLGRRNESDAAVGTGAITSNKDSEHEDSDSSREKSVSFQVNEASEDSPDGELAKSNRASAKRTTLTKSPSYRDLVTHGFQVKRSDTRTSIDSALKDFYNMGKEY
eukprot:TRINITY_DN15656_c0_g1_i4.p1 TRINITY_DN15656_c0_g1~~TRINITY_DN15656_c0_g1_i4.p1  ORF type:complete len:285 (-),score=36.39 TRINITY_DN15656_c0_g1_i4:51-905(-)